MNSRALENLLQSYEQRFIGVDKPQFYNAYQPNADPQMQFSPDAGHPAMNDRMIYMPEDIPAPRSYGLGAPRQEMSSLTRLLGIG